MPSQLKCRPIPGKHHSSQYPEAVQTDLLICLHPFSVHPGFCLLLVMSCRLFLIMHHTHPDKVHCPSDSGQRPRHHFSFSKYKISAQLASYLSMLLMHKSKAYMQPDHPYSDSRPDIRNTSHIIPRTFLKIHCLLMLLDTLRYHSITAVL